MRDLLPISLVGHQAFCPRRAWLEAAGESTDTAQVAIGLRAHSSSDDPSRSRTASVRAVELASEQLGIIGRCDTVEVAEDGSVVVVEHKSTPVRKRAEVTEPMRVQLALQVLALQESGYMVRGAAVWFASHSTRVPVELSPADYEAARVLVEETRTTVEADEAPAPLEDDPRCGGCSHIGVCLPDERALAPISRRVVVADSDSQVLHLATFGSRASVKAGRLVVQRHGEQLASMPLERVQGVVVHGNVDLSGALIRELLWRDQPLVWCSSGGRVVGWSQSAKSPNGGPRARQAVASQDGRLDLAREFVASKIAGQATFLRRHAGAPVTVERLRALQKAAVHAPSLPDLLGVEGEAAARYFEDFELMLSPRVREAEGLYFNKRVRRPARDPLNAALNFTYGLLLADLVRAVMACGLDPHHGFLHSSGRNKPALALDLAEEFRTPVADSTVIGAFNNGELRARHFTDVLGATRLRENGRKILIAAYERRVEGVFTHPVFHYQVSWRRGMEVQARLVLGVLDGSMPRYVGIRTR